jgi:hypothetical protein
MSLKAFKTEYSIIFIAVIIKTIIHLVADSNSGFDGDEVLYIDAGKHLSMGYMEAPPIIGILAYLQNLLHSQSIFVNHIFVHLASAGILVICGCMTIELGGKWKSVLLSMLCITLAPAFGITHNSFQPVIFDQFFWVLCFYYLVRYSKDPENKYLIYLGITAALGFLTKYSMVFFITGLLISVLILRPVLLKNKVLCFSLLLFLVIIFPNIFWQIRNGFPVFDHFSALYKLMANETAAGNATQFFLTLNPFSAPVWIAGIFLVLFSKEFQSYHLYSYSMLFSFLLLIIARGRFYYLFPIVLAAFCAGSVYLVNHIAVKKWALTTYIIIIALTGVTFIPVSLPVTSLKQYISMLGLKTREDGRIPLRFEARYTNEDWMRLTEAVNNTYQQLLPDEKKNCLILGSDYTQTGVINLFGANYGLPKAISFHGSYYKWIPDFSKGITMIAIGNTHLPEEYQVWINSYLQLFEKVESASYIFCPYARDDRNSCFHIYICRGIKYDSEGFRQNFRNRVFE